MPDKSQPTPKLPEGISPEDVKVILAWIAEGESIMAENKNMMFHLGMWWADRPWRQR